MNRTAALMSALILAISLTGCGKVGQLERPGPMFGRAPGSPGDLGAARTQVPSPQVETVDPRDRSTDPAPPRTLPIPGSGPSATSVAPPSALPDPYANPRR